MHRGVDVDIHLRPGLDNDNFIAEALGNLAAFRLGRERQERLRWQVLRVQSSGPKHHFRIVLRHPDRALDLGFKSDLGKTLDELSACSVDQLHEELRRAQADGLRLVPLREVREEVDFWQDDFWSAIGGPSGIAPPGSFP